MLVKTAWQKSAKSCSENIKLAFPEHPAAEKTKSSSTEQVSHNTIKIWLQHYTLQSTLLQVDILLTLETWVCLSSHFWLCSAEMVKNQQCRRLGSVPGLRRSPGRGHGNPLQYSCLENSQGQRSLVGYSPQAPKESDTTEQLGTAQQQPVFGIASEISSLWYECKGKCLFPLC